MHIQTVICESDFTMPGSGRETRRGVVTVPHARQIIKIDPTGQLHDISGDNAMLEIDCLEPCVTIRDGDDPSTTIKDFPLQICVALDADKLARPDDDWQLHIKRFVQRVYPIPSGVPIALTVYVLGWRPDDGPRNTRLAVGGDHGGFRPEDLAETGASWCWKSTENVVDSLLARLQDIDVISSALDPIEPSRTDRVASPVTGQARKKRRLKV